MIIDGLIENTLKNTKLKRVPIKVDPSQLATHGYEHVTSFEGYVLHENDETVQVYMLNLPDQFDPVQMVDKQFVAPAVCNTINPSYENLKKRILLQLEKDGINTTAPGYEKILKSTNQEFLENYLQELGYINEKLKDFFKNIALAQEATSDKSSTGALDILTNNPFYKGFEKAVTAVTDSPKLVAGKGAILGRIGRFIKTLNPRELIDVDKYGAPKDSVKNGDTIYISNLPFRGLKTFKKGTMNYQVQGASTQSIFEGDRKVHKIINVQPIDIDRELDFSLDFSPLGNPEKTGTLIINFTNSREPTRYYNVKVLDYRNIKVLNVLGKLDVETGRIQNQIIQDETRQTVRYALEQLFDDKKPSDMGDLINKISDKILSNKRFKDRKLELLDKVLQGIAALPEDQKAGDLKGILTKQLKSSRLI